MLFSILPAWSFFFFFSLISEPLHNPANTTHDIIFSMMKKDTMEEEEEDLSVVYEERVIQTRSKSTRSH